jgi:hypothetical protein
MTKIKNYRINLRPREIARSLKNEHQIATTPEIELAVDAAIKRWKALVHPAAVYTTLTRTTAEKATSIAFPDKTVAVSVLAATIGPDFSATQASIEGEGAPSEALLMAAVQHEALQQAVQFGIKLLQDQAKEEECELSQAVVAEDPKLVSGLGNLLGTSRIGINAEEGALPPHARLIWVFWSPVGKSSSRKADNASKQKAAA